MKEKAVKKYISILFIIIVFILSIILSSCFNIVQPADKTQTETSLSSSVTTAQSAQSVKEPVENMIRVISPKEGDTVASPLLIKGEARGAWYFEASFPVRLIDSEGETLAVYYAQAQGEWMTEDFVQFFSELIFETPKTETGTLILEKDNPSGLPENDASIEIPVKFAIDNKVVKDTDPSKGEYFAGAILKQIDPANKRIIVEQLINEPNEKIISPEVTLSGDCKIIKIILKRPEEKEIISEISLEDIAAGSEIGIIFQADGTARAIIYQEIVENS